MSDWELLSEEKKQEFIALVQKHYPEIMLFFFEVMKPLVKALQPLLNVIATVVDTIWKEITKHLTEEEIEEIINRFGV